jgi:hypothetical protein
MNDPNNFIWNFTSYGMGGRISNEDQTTFLHMCELDQELEAGKYRVAIWAKVMSENGLNSSVLLFNDTAEFYEVLNLKYQIGSAFLYMFFVGVVGGILYMIFSKDKDKVRRPDRVNKKAVRDYKDIHQPSAAANRAPSPKGRSDSPRSGSPGSGEGKRKASPGKN